MKKIVLILFLSVTALSAMNVAQKLPIGTPTIDLIGPDNQRFTVPEEIALQAQTIADVIKAPFEQEKQTSISLKTIPSNVLNTITSIMHSSYIHKNLKGEILLNAIASDIKLNNQQLIPLLQAFDFLNYPLGIRFITQKAAHDKALAAQITTMIQKEQIGLNTAHEIARIYYLLTNTDLAGIDSQPITFSIRDYLEYQPSKIAIENLGGYLILKLESLRLSDIDGLLDIPLIKNVQHLSLDRNQLNQLPSGIFAGFNKLELLELQRNQLTQLPSGIFVGLNNLKNLSLNNNRLTELPAGIFAGLNNLRHLDLENNRLTELPAGIFAGLNNLRYLSLYKNQLTQENKNRINNVFPTANL